MSLPLVLPILPFDVDSKNCPQNLRLVLRDQIRDVFTRRREFRGFVLSDVGLDALIDMWWKHHQNIIRAGSVRPEWDWNSLSLHFDQDIARPVNLFQAFKDYLILLGRPSGAERARFTAWSFSASLPAIPPSSANYLGSLHIFLHSNFADIFDEIVMEGKPFVPDFTYTSDDALVCSRTVEDVVDFINQHSTEDHRFKFITSGLADILEADVNKLAFNKLPKLIFDKISSLKNDQDGYVRFYDNLSRYLEDHDFDFRACVLKSVGVNQLQNGKGMAKTTVCNKLIKIYYDWLTAVSIGFSGNPYSLFDNTFEYYVGKLKEYVYYTDVPVKIREEGQEGFRLVNVATFDQIFARLQENAKGTVTKESFIVSFHPCDMITCSLGYNWSSCQSWIDDFEDLPNHYGNGNHYGGMYNRGNFQFLCGNGFIAYIPHVLKDVPQYLWAKKKRCLLWVGDNLDCMRQNDFYPGHPKDQESIALAKAIREYIQDVCAPFNMSNGTMDWKLKKDTGYSYVHNISNCNIEERYDPNGSMRYDDPIAAVSYLKSVENPVLYYALNFPRLDTGLPHPCSDRRTSFFASSTGNVCPVCGKSVSSVGYCSNCSKELIEHNGKRVHPKDLISLDVDGVTKHFDITELKLLDGYVFSEDGTAVEFKSAYKVFMPSGIKYFKELPSYVKQCKVCKAYFHPSFMIGDVCIDHFNAALASDSDDDVVVDINEVITTFISKTLSFDCNDTNNLAKLLALLEEKGIKWVSGLNATAYIPSNDSAKKMYLSLNNKGKLILSSQAKSTVVKVSNLFKKGGE